MIAISLENSGCIEDVLPAQSCDDQMIRDKVREVFTYTMGFWTATMAISVLSVKTGLAQRFDSLFSKNISDILALPVFAISTLVATILIPCKYSLLKYGCYGFSLTSKALMVGILAKGRVNALAVQMLVSLALAGTAGSYVLSLQEKGVDPTKFTFGSSLAAFGLWFVHEGLFHTVWPAAVLGTALKSAGKEASNSNFDSVEASMRTDIEYCLLEWIINKCNNAWGCFYEKWQGSLSHKKISS